MTLLFLSDGYIANAATLESQEEDLVIEVKFKKDLGDGKTNFPTAG